jgi:hypothetical protein
VCLLRHAYMLPPRRPDRHPPSRDYA